MSTPVVGQRRASFPLEGIAGAGYPGRTQRAASVGVSAGELSLDPPAARGGPPAALQPLAPHGNDVQFTLPQGRGPVAPHMADHIARLQAEAREINATFDAFDRAALGRTRDLLIRLARPAEAILVQQRIVQFLDYGPQQLMELHMMAELYLLAGQPKKAVDTIERARLEFPGRLMDNQTRARITRSAVLARLLIGDMEGAKEELRRLGPHHYDHHALLLRAMARPSDKRATALQDPADRILFHLWCGRSLDALASLDQFVREHVPQPGVALPKDVRKFAETVLFSPIVAASPLREVLTYSHAWKLLLEHCQPAHLSAIAVDAPVPDLKSHVLDALVAMNLPHLARRLAHKDVPRDDLYNLVSSYYPRWDDPRIKQGVQLQDRGRDLLANYLNRKWGASITVHARGIGADTVLADIVKRAAGTPGDVRCSLNFGGLHGVCAVYIREQGKEAILFSDSMTGSGDSTEASAIQDALLLIGRDMPLYRQSVPTQTDGHSCFVQSMKTAVTLTRRIRDENGNWGPFLIPNLISELESTITDEESFGFIPTRALPEIAKMAQGPLRLDEHLKAGTDGQLRDSRQGLTLREFVGAHSVSIEHTRGRTDVFDYVRQKGLRSARNIDIEAWNLAILAEVGGAEWSPALQNEFAARVKALAQPDSA